MRNSKPTTSHTVTPAGQELSKNSSSLSTSTGSETSDIDRSVEVISTSQGSKKSPGLKIRIPPQSRLVNRNLATGRTPKYTPPSPQLDASGFPIISSDSEDSLDVPYNSGMGQSRLSPSLSMTGLVEPDFNATTPTSDKESGCEDQDPVMHPKKLPKHSIVIGTQSPHKQSRTFPVGKNRKHTLQQVSRSKSKTPKKPAEKRPHRHVEDLDDASSNESPTDDIVVARKGPGHPKKEKPPPVERVSAYILIRRKPKFVKGIKRGKGKVVQPEPILNGPITITFSGGFVSLVNDLAEEAGVNPGQISVRSLSWSIAKSHNITKAATSGLPLNNEAGFRTLVQQIQSHRQPDTVMLAIAMDAMNVVKNSWLAASESEDGVDSDEGTARRSGGVKENFGRIDDRLAPFVAELEERYPIGTCVEHPDLICVRYSPISGDDWHFELTQARCKAWALHILRCSGTADKPPVGSTLFKKKDTIATHGQSFAASSTPSSSRTITPSHFGNPGPYPHIPPSPYPTPWNASPFSFPPNYYPPLPYSAFSQPQMPSTPTSSHYPGPFPGTPMPQGSHGARFSHFPGVRQGGLPASQVPPSQDNSQAIQISSVLENFCSQNMLSHFAEPLAALGFKIGEHHIANIKHSDLQSYGISLMDFRHFVTVYSQAYQLHC